MLIPRRTFLAWTLSSTTGVIPFLLANNTQTSRKPKHLEDALVLLRGLLPENNKYQHRPTVVVWKGDDGASDYVSKADCSGFMNKLLSHSYGFTPERFQQWMGRKRPLAENYHDVIIARNSFTQIAKLKQVQPGDVIAIKYPEGEDTTGHVLLVAETPKERRSSDPLVTGTTQWETTVIDQSRSGHGETDTRRKPDGSFYSGLGQGVLRVYSNEEGDIAGYSWSTSVYSDYYSLEQRHLVIGRLNQEV